MCKIWPEEKCVKLRWPNCIPSYVVYVVVYVWHLINSHLIWGLWRRCQEKRNNDGNSIVNYLSSLVRLSVGTHSLSCNNCGDFTVPERRRRLHWKVDSQSMGKCGSLSFCCFSILLKRPTIAPLLGLSSLQCHNHLITAFSDRLFGGGFAGRTLHWNLVW